MVLGLDQVEFALMRVVVLADILVSDIDFGCDLLVEDFFDGEGATEVAAEVVKGDLFVLEFLIELFLGVRRLDLVHFAIDLLVGGEEAEFLGAMHEDFVVDELAEDAEAKAGGLLAHGNGLLLIGSGRLVEVILFDVVAEDFAAVDAGNHISAPLLGLAGREEHQGGSGATRESALEQHRVESQARSPSWCGSAIRRSDSHFAVGPETAGAGAASACTGGWTPAWVSARLSTARNSAIGRAPSISSPLTKSVGVAVTPTESPS